MKRFTVVFTFLFLSIIHHELGNPESATRCYQRALNCADTTEAVAAGEWRRFRDFTRALLHGMETSDNGL